jgi:RES domain-containing protein
MYTGRTIAIAALEKLVHLSAVVPRDLVVVRVDMPGRYSSETPTLADLPKDWNATRPPRRTMEFGTQWARENRSLVLFVPSAIVPEEFNAVINPNHAEFGGVTMRIERTFQYDPRILTRRMRGE